MFACVFLFLKKVEDKKSYSLEKNAETFLESKEDFNEVGSKKDEINHIKEDLKKEVEEDMYIYVHIFGEVKKPGLYKIKEKERLASLIELAGGFTEKANKDYNNLAKKLEDEEKIYIPSIDENVEDLDKRHKIDTPISKKESNKININLASEDELLTLRGIGKNKAKQIIEYRENVSKFSKIEDIMKISGIKKSAFEKIKDSICVR